MSIEKLAINLSQYISRNIGLNTVDEKKTYYGILIMLYSIVKVIVILSIAAFLGYLKSCILVLIVYGLFKSFTGGYHCDSYYKCLIVGTILFNGTAAFIGKITILPGIFVLFHSIILLIFFVLINYIYPIKNEVRAVKVDSNKAKTYLYILTSIHTMIFMIIYKYNYNYLISFAAGLYLNIIFSLKIGKSIINIINRGFDTILGKG